MPLLMTFRGINVLLFALGTAALVATIASWPLRASSDAAWASHLTAFTLKIAFAFLPASLAAFLLMPSASNLVPELAGAETSAPPTIIRLLLLALGAVTLLQVPGLFTWWLEDWALLRELFGSRADPSGLDLIPSAILLSMPILGAATLLSFTLSSILGNTVRVELFRVLAAGASLQAGLITGGYLILHEMQKLGALLVTLIANSPDAVASTLVTGWFSRHIQLGRAVDRRLLWTFGGYLVVLMLTGYLAGWRKPPPTADNLPRQ